jgi:DNA-binding IclR family transcriptional regulator
MKVKVDTVQSVERAMAVLRELALEPEMGVRELSVRLGLGKSTVHRLLATLKTERFVEQNASEKYRLGMKLFEYGHVVLGRLEIRKEALPEMEKLAATTGETVNLGILDGFDVVHIERIDSTEPLSTGMKVGRRSPAHCLGLGKAIMANLPPAEREALLNDSGFRGSLRKYTDTTIADADELRGHLDAVRRQGFAIDEQEYFLGARCVAVPVFNHTGRVVAAVSVVGPTVRLTVDKVEEFIPLVLETGRNISRRLGFNE